MGMEDVLRIDKILDFCDVPQLFVARDAFDTLYLCLLYDDETVYRLSLIHISNKGITHVYPESPDVFDRSNTIRLLTKMSNGDIDVYKRQILLY